MGGAKKGKAAPAVEELRAAYSRARLALLDATAKEQEEYRRRTGGFRCREELEAELEKKHGPKIRALWAREQAATAALDKWGLAPENEKDGLMREKPTICAECNHAMHTNRPRESWECGVDIVELDVITGQKKGRPCVELNKGACEKFAPRPPMDIYRSFRTTSTGKAFGQGTLTDAYGKQRLEILPL